MNESILESTKKVLGLNVEYTAFDLDITMHINAAFSVLTQLGLGPSEGFFIEDGEPTWNNFDARPVILGMVRTYVFLYVRQLFDPPTTSFVITAMDNRMKEYEWRLSALREQEVEVL